MLHDYRQRMAGTASPGLRSAAEADINAHLRQLITTALRRWSEEQFSTFSRDELSYSVRLFHFCELIIAENQDEHMIMHVLHDAQQPTRDMLLGLAHPRSSPRPDFTVIIGAVKFRLEAKRLKASAGLPALYVREGMARFTSGRYESTRPFPGVMIGYVEADSVQQACKQVNKVIKDEPGFGEGHQLRAIRRSSGQFAKLHVYESNHDDALAIHHYVVDVQ